MDATVTHPLVTVLMPVYNAETHLAKAIDSILAQSFSDFEFIIINDGSSDGSKEIIRAYDDKRIRYLENPENLKITKTLNRGIRLAKGQYIARMDADDVSLLHRLKEQVHLMDENPEIDALFSTITHIDDKGRQRGTWLENNKALHLEEIRRTLPRENCLAHPSVMFQKRVIETYMYDERSDGYEDYELWLRMVADGRIIHNISEALVEYRVFEGYFLHSEKKHLAELRKNARAKSRFLLSRLSGRGLFSRFVRDVIKGWARDWFQISQITLTGFVRSCVIWTGGVAGFCFPKTSNNGQYFFFPFHHLGGAEKVHLDIVGSLCDTSVVVVFCDLSKSAFFKKDFEQHSRVFDQSRLTRSVVGKAFMTGYWATVINRTTDPRVFGSNTTFFYRLIPYLKPESIRIDLIHAFGGGIENISLPCLDKLDTRVVVNPQTLVDFQQQYLGKGIDEHYQKRIVMIENCTDIPEGFERVRQDTLSVLFAGRGDEDKRPWLVGEIAQVCLEQGLSVNFTMIGAQENSMRQEHRSLCDIVGEVNEPQDYYRRSDILILPSSLEGFPLVVMEAMAFGVVPICTDVGGVRFHLQDSENGYLVSSSSEQDIVQHMVKIIGQLDANRCLLEEISNRAADYAMKHFRRDVFNLEYRKLLQ
jgi:glycosyltransferase involved in cell wall biosynthesis